ncbi:MAG: T9SS type A sorting domain-containing protein, partial [Flavobacteriales bacterium]
LTEGYLASMLNGVITDTSSWFVYSWDNGQLSTLTSYHTPFGIDDIRNRETYSYNYAGDLIETIYSNWDDDIQDFVNDEKDALIYINSDLSSSFHSSWDTGSNTWVVESKTENAYTQGGLLIEAVSSDWDEESLTYLLKKRYTYEYQLGTLTNSLTEYYHTNWQNWNPLFNYEYSFQNCTPVLHVGEQNVGLGVEMYPNPASSRINLKFGNSKTAQSYRIFNLKGQIVQTDRLFKEPEEIDISNLSAGMYILELLIDNNRTRKTLVVE